MQKKLLLLSTILITFLFTPFITHSESTIKKNNGAKASITVPQPTSCVVGSFTQAGNNWWSEVTLKLTNQCGKDIDFQNTTVTFNNKVNLNTSFWGDFSPLSYPDNNLQITSTLQSANNYLATFSLHFPEDTWSNTVLPSGKSVTIKYGVPYSVFDPKYIAGSVKVYLNSSQPIQTGTINLTNITAKPANVTQNFVQVNVVNGSQTVANIQLPWAGQYNVTNLAAGNYSIQPLSISDSAGNNYVGTAVPATVTVVENSSVSSTIKYDVVPAQFGKINIAVAALPSALSGYTGTPIVQLTRNDTGATTSKTVTWNATTTVDQLPNNVTYSFKTPVINFNNNTCSPSFSPLTVISNAQTPPTTTLTYTCVPVQTAKVTLNISGLPNSTTSLVVTFTPNDGSSAVNKTVTITNGQGTDTINLNNAVIYNVSATSITGYTALFNPQPLTAINGATETITFQSQPTSSGRIIGFMPGWKATPPVTELSSAGYTHIMVAFGVFSTTQPGQIVSAFDTITKAYITSLHNAGIKVLLSLGGASTSIANTSVDFHQVLSLASSPTAFQQTFVQSVKQFVTDYGFDGIDIDIEHGINAGGTFANPTGDIAVLANILNQLHKDLPNFLITLTPQVANISATSGFDATWGNYASLIMQTYSSLTWVGVQNYNAGCAYGIDMVCYDPNNTSSPDFSVAMAVDLLANWPATTPSGQATGFQPYVSHLRPDQVVMGYPVVNAQGQSDGSPATPTSTIKRAVQCLKTAVKGTNSCGNYVPPKAYGLIGGVFNWEVTFDQSNGYKFAKDLKACVIDGNC